MIRNRKWIVAWVSGCQVLMNTLHFGQFSIGSLSFLDPNKHVARLVGYFPREFSLWSLGSSFRAPRSGMSNSAWLWGRIQTFCSQVGRIRKRMSTPNIKLCFSVLCFIIQPTFVAYPTYYNHGWQGIFSKHNTFIHKQWEKKDFMLGGECVNSWFILTVNAVLHLNQLTTLNKLKWERWKKYFRLKCHTALK